MTIYGKQFQILSCDQFTHDYLLNDLNIDFPVKDNGNQEPQSTNNIIIPPYNGFGAEEDSLGYVYRLVPKPPKKDFFKWVDNQVILRYSAQFKTSQPEDVDRRFVIQYFCNDDSLLVYEPPRRNSGIVEGKFLERGKYRNPDNNEFFKPSDFATGNCVNINGYEYKVIGIDNFSDKWQ